MKLRTVFGIGMLALLAACSGGESTEGKEEGTSEGQLARREVAADGGADATKAPADKAPASTSDHESQLPNPDPWRKTDAPQ